MFSGRYRIIDKYIAVKKHGYLLLINSFYPQYRYFLPVKFQPVLNYFKFSRDNHDIDNLCKGQGLRKVISDMIKLKFLVLADFNEWNRMDYFRKIKEQRDGISILYVVPTMRCNLNCKYCFIYQNEPPNAKRKKMKWETLTKAVDYFFRQYKRSEKDKSYISVLFYGGEPLVEEDFIEKSAKYINRIKTSYGVNKEIEFILNTNGTLLNQKTVDMLEKNKIYPVVSFDGIPASNDKMRIFRATNKGVSSQALNGIRMLEEKGVSYDLCLTLWQHNADYYKNLKWISKNLKPKNINIVFYHPPLMPPGNQERRISIYSKEDILKLIKTIKELGLCYSLLGMYRKMFNDFTPILHYCGASGGQMAVHPDGYIGNCHATLNSKRGFIKMDSLPSDLVKHPNWILDIKNGPVYKRDCYLRCEYFSLCRGGCMHDAEALYGNRFEIDPLYCNFTKAVIEIFCEELIEKEIGIE